MQDLWKKKAIAEGFDPEMVKAYGERLSEAVKKGFGKDYAQIDFNTIDYRQLHNLEQQVWQFSTAKNYTQLKEMTNALRKPDGSMRDFYDFRIQASIIAGGHVRHLKTEYSTAIASSQMAAKWANIQKMKESYPLLQFIAVEDEHTTNLCRSIDEVIRPVDDPFWQQFYPPNHYNCRSTVKQLREGEITPTDKLNLPVVPNIFKVNLGERSLAFPEDHAYFEGTPAEVIERGRQYFPYNMQMNIRNESDQTQGIVRQHYQVQITDEVDRIVELAIAKAKEDKIMVDILPKLDNGPQRSIIFPDAKAGKSPALRIDKVLHSVKRSDSLTTLNKEHITDLVSDGLKEASHVIIVLHEAFEETELKAIQQAKFRSARSLQYIEFRMPGKNVIYKRKGA